MKHIHIIGIGGTFMGGLAAIAKQAGFHVSGCDAKMYPPMSTQLKELNIETHEGFDAEQLNTFHADIYVIGNVAKRGMPIIEAILNQNLPYTSGPQWLSENILHQHHVLAVAGTHGKTTTASMLAWVLEYANLDPAFLIGGIPHNFGISARLSPKPKHNTNDPTYFVIEADEYDTAFFDKRSKFVHYHPKTAILNNLEYDHADIFANLSAIETQFHHLIRTIPSHGLIIANEMAPSILETLQQGCWTPIEYFGGNQDWQSNNINIHGDSFDVQYKGQTVGHITWNLLGEHNRMNALAVIAAANHIGIAPQQSCIALSQFQNVKRRMEIKGISQRNITVYDDFAHHPTAIATTIHGLRQKIGNNQRIIAVFEPRSNTMKMGTLATELSQSLNEADLICCYTGNINWDINTSLAPLNQKLYLERDFDIFVNHIASIAQNNDHILIMSNGNFNNIHQTLLSKLD